LRYSDEVLQIEDESQIAGLKDEKPEKKKEQADTEKGTMRKEEQLEIYMTEELFM
jgi:hypothetical protein